MRVTALVLLNVASIVWYRCVWPMMKIDRYKSSLRISIVLGMNEILLPRFCWGPKIHLKNACSKRFTCKVALDPDDSHREIVDGWQRANSNIHFLFKDVSKEKKYAKTKWINRNWWTSSQLNSKIIMRMCDY